MWAKASDAAQRFWTVVRQGRADVPSKSFKALVADNLAVAQAFVAPLLPSPRPGQ